MVIQDKALHDAEKIKDYIRSILLNNKAANDFVEKLDQRYNRIMQSPYLYPEAYFGHKKYRYAMVGKYMIVFRTDESTHTVYVIAIGHSLQKRKNITKGK